MRVFAVVVVHNPDMPTSGNQRKLEFSGKKWDTFQIKAQKGS